MIIRSITLIFILLAHFSAFGQSLVMDIDTSTEASNPKGMKSGKSGVVFLAQTPEYGLELFRSDGTAEGTNIFMDHNPGPSDLVLWDYEVFDDHVFYALDKVKVIEIRKASIKDGTSTLIAKIDTRLNYKSYEPDRFKLHFTQLTDWVFFFFPNEVNELDLWIIDTKNDETKVVHTFPQYFKPQCILSAQDQVFFSVSHFLADTTQLWSYHPNQQQAVYNGPIFGRPVLKDILTFKNAVFFTNWGSNQNKSKSILWTSDGSANGLQPVLNPLSGQAMQDIEFLKTFKGKLYVLDFLEETRRTLWRLSDPKGQPEAALTSKKGEYGFGYGSQFGVTQDFIYFKRYTASTDAYSLCRTNGEIGNTTTLVEFPKKQDPTFFFGSGDCLYYSDKSNHALWKVGDTEASPILLYTSPDSLQILAYNMKSRNGNGKLFYALSGKGYDKCLLYSGGSLSNTRLFTYTPYGANEHLDCNLFWQGKLFLSLHDPQYGIELWIYDPEKDKLSLLKDINLRNAGSQPVVMTLFRGSIYACIRDRFYSFNQDSKYVKITPYPTLKVSNIGITTLHTSENIQLVLPDSLMIVDKRFLVSEEKIQKLFPQLRDIAYITKLGKSHLFQGVDEKVGREYWIVDEKFEQIKLLKDIAPGREVGENGTTFIKMSDTLGLFVGKSKDIGSVIWRTNGSPQNTFPLCKGLEEVMDKSYDINILGKFKDELFVNFYTRSLGYELWKINGYTGASLVKDIFIGKSGSYPHGFIPFKEWFYFPVDDGIYGTELWRSDGTPENTHLFKDICPPLQNHPNKTNPDASPSKLVSNSKYLFMEILHPNSQLWRSDGTPDGTIFLANIKPKGYEKWLYGKSFKIGPLVYFPAANHLGIELWQTDGTPQNTYQTFDLNPGPEDGSPDNLVVINGEVYFSGNDGIHGNELFKFTPSGNTKDPSPINIMGGKNHLWTLQITKPGFIPSKARIELWTTDGELKPIKFSFTSGKAVLNLQKFESGTYWLYIVENGKTWIKGIVKSNH